MASEYLGHTLLLHNTQAQQPLRADFNKKAALLPPVRVQPGGFWDRQGFQLLSLLSHFASCHIVLPLCAVSLSLSLSFPLH